MADTAAINSVIKDRALEHVWFHVTPPKTLRARNGLTVFERGEGCYLFDEEGRSYLDALSGGAFVTNIGHGRKEVAEAYARQAEKLAYVTPYSFVAQPTADLATKLASLAPGDLNRVFFDLGGRMPSRPPSRSPSSIIGWVATRSAPRLSAGAAPIMALPSTR